VLDRLEEDLAALDSAERRMDDRAAARGLARERRERRRRWLGDRFRVPLLALLGTVAVAALLEAEGGDLGGWPRAAALVVLAVLTLGPPALAGWLARARGTASAVAIGLITLGAQLALTYGLAAAVLGLGPSTA
jgi:hypothetical protein